MPNLKEYHPQFEQAAKLWNARLQQIEREVERRTLEKCLEIVEVMEETVLNGEWTALGAVEECFDSIRDLIQ